MQEEPKQQKIENKRKSDKRSIKQKYNQREGRAAQKKGKKKEENRANLRNTVLQLSNITKEQTRMKVIIDIALLIRHNLCAEKMTKLEVSIEVLPQIYGKHVGQTSLTTIEEDKNKGTLTVLHQLQGQQRTLSPRAGSYDPQRL